ncbi:MAG: hypothetical protein AAF541_12240 [Pseudomonadota bacterium]
MRKVNPVDIVQILTGVAVVVGIGLVVVELQQNREATQSQLSTESYQIWTQLKSASLGDNAPDVLAKACLSPQKLSGADYMILQNYYSVIINSIVRNKELSMGTFYDDRIWQDAAMGGFMEMFATTPGQGYWKTIAPRWVDPTVLEFGNVLLANMPPPNCGEDFKGWRNYVNTSIEDTN